MRLHKNPGLLPKGKVIIIGGTGRMGRLFARILSTQADISIFSRDIEKAKKVAKKLGVGYVGESDLRYADIIIVSVPIDVTAQICKWAAKKMRRGALLVEISSAKEQVAKELIKGLPKRIGHLSIHPLFGPGVRNFRGKNFIAVGPLGKRSKRFIRMLERVGGMVSLSTPKRHDEAMASVQALRHIALISLAGSLPEKRIPKRLQTASSRQILSMLKAIDRNLDAILQIQHCNKYAKDMRKRFAQVAVSLSKKEKEALSKEIKGIFSNLKERGWI